MSSTRKEERNTEIWSTRLQRELLALTTDDAPAAEEAAVMAVLPPFCSYHSHVLDIAGGTATISFLLDLLPAAADAAAKKKNNEQSPEQPTTSTSDAAEEEEEEDKAATNSNDDTTAEDPLIVQLDVSLVKTKEGKVDPLAIAYPFCPPTASLVSGAGRLPAGSTLQAGQPLDLDMDWTPSLHLTDAILNLALKLKECILQGEPVHPAPLAAKPKGGGTLTRLGKGLLRGLGGGGGGGGGSNNNSKESKEKKRLFRKSKALPKKESNAGQIRVGQEINMLEAPWVDCQGVYSCKAIRRPPFVEQTIAAAAASVAASSNATPEAQGTTSHSDAPSDDLAVFMRQQAEGIGKAANAGIVGAGAMFRSITKSARSVLEESFLMITETHIIELKSNKLNLSTGTIAFAIPIELLAKLKFRRQESVSLFFKPAPDDPLIYMCPDSADCVHQIQSVLKRHGVKGKHTNAATHRAINQALHLVQAIQTKELALKHDPTVERVNEIMDLHRQAAERFEVAGDVRHEEVVTHMRKFLALPLTVSILDGSYKKPDSSDVMATPTGEGVVLEAGENADEKAANSSNKDDDKAFEMNMENILKEAEADLANLEVEDDPELDAMIEEQEQLGINLDDDDAVTDFEKMLKEADNELAELMNS